MTSNNFRMNTEVTELFALWSWQQTMTSIIYSVEKTKENVMFAQSFFSIYLSLARDQRNKLWKSRCQAGQTRMAQVMRFRANLWNKVCLWEKILSIYRIGLIAPETSVKQT